MNKIISINISGVIFHIEENAYQILQNYLSAIHNHFYNSSGKDEIVNDIEARIAEIFQAKINDKKQVIVLSDVEEMIKIMGNPEDFGNNDGEEANEGGPKSGGGNFKNYYPFNRGRLFRDGESRVLGGVCSGLGHAFSIDPLIFRIIFILFMFMGFGVLLYIILWLIIPKAITASEKLEMKREPINISNIEKNIQDEFDELKKKYKSQHNKHKHYWSGGENEWVKRSFDITGSLIYYLLRALTIFLGIILLFIGLSLLILLIVIMTKNFDANMVMPGGFLSIPSVSQFMDVLYTSSFDASLSMISLFLLIGIPLIMLVYGAFKLIFRINSGTRFISGTLGSLWFLSLLTSIYCVFIAFTGFKETGVSSNYMDLPSQTNRVLYVDVNKDTLNYNNIYAKRSKRSKARRNINVNIDGEDVYSYSKHSSWKKIIFNDKMALLTTPNLVIDKSNSDNFEVKIIRTAKGEDTKQAIRTASKINYNITSNDTLLTLEPYYSFDKKMKWRAQEVTVLIKVPIGKSIYLPSSVESMINHAQNISDLEQPDTFNQQWLMTEKGLVRDIKN